MRTEINFALGKGGGYMNSSLGGRLISVGRQVMSERVSETKIFPDMTTSILKLLKLCEIDL